MINVLFNSSAPLGIDSQVFENAQSPSNSGVLSKIYQECVKILPEFQVLVDFAPVMESGNAYAAQIQHDDRVIIINGYVLKRSSHPAKVKSFLIFHELFHELCRRSPERAKTWIHDLGQQSEERGCDVVGIYGANCESA
jgi:hypothetical protein